MKPRPEWRPQPRQVLTEQVILAGRLQWPLILAWVLAVIVLVALRVFTIIPLLLLAVVWPVILWRREPPSRRGFMWAAPLPRGWHAVVRIAAGWLVLVALVAAHLALQGVIALAADRAEIIPTVALSYAAHAVVSVTCIYLLSSAVALRFENLQLPILSALLVLLTIALLALEPHTSTAGPAARLVLQHLSLALVPGGSTTAAAWLPPALGWLMIGVATSIAAAFAHQEPHRSP